MRSDFQPGQVGDAARTFAALLNGEVFGELPEAELQQVMRLVKVRSLRAGESLAVRGQPLSGMVLALEGALEVLLDSAPICTLSPGSIFCEDAVVEEATAPASVRAASPCRVGILERPLVAAELGHLPHLRRALEQAWRRRVLAARLYQIDLFQALSLEARSLVLERFERIELPPGSVLATEGEGGDTFTFIRAGEGQLHLDPRLVDPNQAAPEDGGDPGQAKLHAGDYLGETNLVDDAPQSATVTTAQGLTAMCLSRAQFEEALSTLPGQLDEARRAFQARSEAFF